MATIGAYPTSVYIDTLIDRAIEYRVERYEFEDGSLEVNVQPCGIRRWELRYTGLSVTDLNTLRTHYNDAKGRVNDFSFTHRRDATTYTGVKYVSFDIPARSKNWINEAVVVLEKLQ
jgi:hypothetical protein